MAKQPEKPLRELLWGAYEEDLAPIVSQLPVDARKYALASWHCDPTDHRCIHDAWVETISVVEAGTGARKEIRSMGVVIRLLAAHHDRRLILKFPGVRRYSVQRLQSQFDRPNAGHGDVLDDSIKLASDGYLLYTLRTEFGTVEIEAKDLQFSQQPI